MYLWRVTIAVTFGLIWYFSDSGRIVLQYFVCSLLCLATPLLFGNSGRESGTQTDEETKEHPLQEIVEEDFTDSTVHFEPSECQCPHVKKSLQLVFKSAYTQLISPWYGVAESWEQQPLHRMLSREFDFVFDRIIERARNFDVCQAVVGSIRILTQHLHNAKQSDRELLFRSRTEEIAVLREFSEALVRNLFPQSLWGQEVNRCALNEIIALKGIGLLVDWLSDPDNLNQLVVSQLDSDSLKNSVEELRVSDLDQASLASQEGESERESPEVGAAGGGISPGSGIKGKRRGNKIKEGWSKFVDKMKTKRAKKKKMKTMEQALVMRIMAFQGDVSNEDDVSSREGSVLTQDDSERDDSDLDDYFASVQEDMIEFKLSYEMWRVGCWAVSIPHADWEEEKLIFTVHLEEKDNPENLQWDIKKSYMDIIYFRNRWQDSPNLPTIVTLEESVCNDVVKEEARASVEHFLQELVSDNGIGHTQPVFQFLCPLDKLLNEEVPYGGVWSLLSGIAYFLTPGQEEEENSNLQTEVPKENRTPSPHSESIAMSVEHHPIENGHTIAPPSLPAIVVSQYNTPPKLEEAEVFPDPQVPVNLDSSFENSAQDRPGDAENPVTSHFKMIFRGLTRSRSQESLVSSRMSGDEELSDSGSQHEGTEGLTWLGFNAKSNKKERIHFRMAVGHNKTKGKETQGTLQRGEDSHGQRGQVNKEQPEATKAIFDLLKEISGNSILLNIFDAILKPVMPILKKKVNTFLKKLNPTEEQMAAYIDTLRSKQWPEIQSGAAPQLSPLRTEEEKEETKERAHNLISSRYSNYLVLKKTDMESVFNLFQDKEENKTLVYMLLSFLLKEFLPNEHSLNLRAAFLQKVNTTAT